MNISKNFETLFDKIKNFYENNQFINQKNIFLCLALFSEFLFYFLFFKHINAFFSSRNLSVLFHIVFIGFMINTIFKPSIALGLLLLILLFPFIYFPIQTFISLFILLIFLLIIKNFNSFDYHIFITIICFTIISLNNKNSLLLLIIPITLYFIYFGISRHVFSINYFLFISIILILIPIYSKEDNSLISAINNAPLYVYKDTNPGLDSLSSYYMETTSDKKNSRNELTHDQFFIDYSKDKKGTINSNSIIALITYTSIGYFITVIGNNYYIKNQSILRRCLSFALSSSLFILLIKESTIILKGNDISMNSSIPLILLSLIISLIIILIFYPIVYSLLDESKNEEAIENNSIYNEKEYSTFESLSSIGASLNSILTDLCNETLHLICSELYDEENWFFEIKRIMLANPKFFNDPTAILNYKDMDISNTTRLLTDSHFPIERYIMDAKSRHKNIKTNIELARRARNGFAHNNTFGQLDKTQIYVLYDSCNTLRACLYTNFPNGFNSQISESYYNKIEDLKILIDRL